MGQVITPNGAPASGLYIGQPFSDPLGPGGAFYDLGLTDNPTNAWGFIQYNSAQANSGNYREDDGNDEMVIAWETLCFSEFDNPSTGFSYTTYADELAKEEFWPDGEGPCGLGTGWGDPGNVRMDTLYDQFGSDDFIQVTDAAQLKVPTSNWLNGRSAYAQISNTDNNYITSFLNAVGEIEFWVVQIPEAASKTAFGCSSQASGFRARDNLWRVQEDSGSDVIYAHISEIQILHYYWDGGTEIQFNRYTQTNGAEETTVSAGVPAANLSGNAVLGVTQGTNWPIGNSYTCPPILMKNDSWGTSDRSTILTWHELRYGITIS